MSLCHTPLFLLHRICSLSISVFISHALSSTQSSSASHKLFPWPRQRLELLDLTHSHPAHPCIAVLQKTSSLERVKLLSLQLGLTICGLYKPEYYPVSQ